MALADDRPFRGHKTVEDFVKEYDPGLCYQILHAAGLDDDGNIVVDGDWIGWNENAEQKSSGLLRVTVDFLRGGNDEAGLTEDEVLEHYHKHHDVLERRVWELEEYEEIHQDSGGVNYPSLAQTCESPLLDG